MADTYGGGRFDHQTRLVQQRRLLRPSTPEKRRPDQRERAVGFDGVGGRGIWKGVAKRGRRDQSVVDMTCCLCLSGDECFPQEQASASTSELVPVKEGGNFRALGTK